MVVKVIKHLRYIPRFIVSMLAVVGLTLLALAIAAASFLGVTMAMQGWATHPATTINAPVPR